MHHRTTSPVASQPHASTQARLSQHLAADMHYRRLLRVRRLYRRAKRDAVQALKADA
jgi:hypothetical protein